MALAAYSDAGHLIFRTIALALDRPGLVATPLHTLERGGARWERLAVEEGREGGASWEVAGVVSLDPSADLAYLSVPDLPACTASAGAEATAGERRLPALGEPSGSQVLVLRERSGYRPAAVGGQVLRAVALADGRRLLLVRLLDARGADPGLMLDDRGALVGSVAPPAAGSDPALAAVVSAEPAPSEARENPPPRSIQTRKAPTFASTVEGMTAEALILGGSGRIESALDHLEEAIGHGGPTAALLIERGALRYAAGQLSSAVTDFTSAAEADPASYLARFNLGVVLGVSGRYDEAAEAFRKARDLDPSMPRARFELALALRAGNHGEAARNECEALDSLDPTLARELRLLLGF